MKRTILPIWILLLASRIVAQNFIPSEAKKYQSLIGEVYMLTLFIDTMHDYWDNDEMDYFLSELEKSQEWIIEESRKYGVNLNFNNEYFQPVVQNVFVRSVNRQNSWRLLQTVMNELGYRSYEDFLDRYNFDLRKKKLKVLFFVKSDSRSHAYNYWSNNNLDFAIVYCKSTYGQVTNHYVISHELLHQFGAWDLYYGESQSLEKAKRAKELYPNSVMISTNAYDRELEIDELTAWRIGWHHNLKDEFMSFKPVRKERRDRNTRWTFDLKKRKNKN
jgi:hypothetical protein